MSKHNRGGQARAAKLTPEQRKAIAQKAARKRWNRPELAPAPVDIHPTPATQPEPATGFLPIPIQGAERILKAIQAGKGLTLAELMARTVKD